MSPRWLLLAHQLPTRTSNARVKTWRRLQHIGAVPTRNSVYVLPNSDQCREDFEWLRSEIVALGGEATLFAADALDPADGDVIAATFQDLREADYRNVEREAGRLLPALKRRPSTPAKRLALRRAVRAIRERLSEIERTDFFEAKRRDAAEAAVRRLEVLAADRPVGQNLSSTTAAAADSFRGRRWVTRPRPGIDRIASAWLIRRYIDPDAIFAFVERPDESEIPFDMYEGEFSHQGPLCTFETLAQRFGIGDAAVTRLGRVVHDLDMKDDFYKLPETESVGRIVAGLRELQADDHVLLTQGMHIFEALAHSLSSVSASRSTRSHARGLTPRQLPTR